MRVGSVVWYSLVTLAKQRTQTKSVDRSAAVHSMSSEKISRSSTLLFVLFIVHTHVISISDPVHTNPFSNENGAVLLRFQKDLRPH